MASMNDLAAPMAPDVNRPCVHRTEILEDADAAAVAGAAVAGAAGARFPSMPDMHILRQLRTAAVDATVCPP